MKRNSLLLITSLLVFNFTGFIQTVSTPVMARVMGDYFIGGVSPMPSLGDIGTLDATFDDDGSLSLAAQMSGGQAKAIQVLSDGKYLVGLSKSSSNSVVAKYTATGLVESTANFGTSGIADLGTTAEVHSMIVDDQSRILVAGGNDSAGTTGFLKRISADGDTVVSFVSGSPWRFIGGIARQVSGKIIVVGHDGTNAMMARYTAGSLNTPGVIDTTFGSAATGYIIFNGAQISGLTSTSGLYNVLVDANDKIYISYLEGTTANVVKFTAAGALDTSFDFPVDGISPVSYLDSATSDTLRMALAANGDLVCAAQVSSRICVSSIKSSDGTAGSYANFTSNTIGATAREIRNVITTSDDKVFLIGSNIADKKMSVIRLTSAGALDIDFNTVGYNEFLTGSSSSYLYAADISPDGRLYAAGVLNSGSNVPYVSRLYNDLYVSQVAQFPATEQVGILDTTFGTSSEETYDGVVQAFNGITAASLQQKAQTVIELASGKILVGMEGLTDTSATLTMMITRMSAAGVFDATFGTASDGFLTLQNVTSSAEHLLSMVEDASANIYVAGSCSTGATLRKYTSASTSAWTAGTAAWAVVDTLDAAGQGVQVLLQGTTRVLLFVNENGTNGHISGYTIEGSLDTANFHSDGSTPGKILSTDFSLNMGPVYGAVVNRAGNIIIAYKNSSTGAIDVAAIYADGSGLISQFATNGVYTNIFSTTTIAANNVRVGLDSNHNVVIVASTGTDYKITRLDGEVGTLDNDFHSGIVVGNLYDNPDLFRKINTQTRNLDTYKFLTSYYREHHSIALLNNDLNLILKQITVLSDDSILITVQDDIADDIMVVTKVTSDGILDSLFNPEGATPGILPIQISNRIANYSARVLTGLAVQSTGDLILVGYEQQLSSDATPMVMRAFGTSGTTAVKTCPTTTQIPGTIDTEFDTDGALDLTSLINEGAAKVVYAYRNDDTYEGKLLIGIDASDSTSVLIARVDASDMTLDASFGTGGILTIASLSGLNSISLDAQSRIVIGGTYAGAGWAKRLTTAGVVDADFTMPSNFVGINVILQQKSGRYLVAGIDGAGKGVIVAFKDSTTGPLEIDPTFNPLGTGAVVSRRNVSTTGLYNLSINDDDTILAAYSATTVKISKIKADGSALDDTFGTSGIKDTGITPSAASSIRLVIDSNDKVCVAATVGTTSLSIVRYTSAGAADVTFNTDGSVKTMTNVGTGSVVLSHLMATNQAAGEDKIIALGYNTAGGNGRMFAVRLGTNGALDAAWNSGFIGTDTVGVTTFDVASATRMYAASITINGNIFACATTTTEANPLLIHIFGDNYISEAEQAPKASAAGTLDTTLGQADSKVIDDISGLSTLNGSIPKLLHIFSDSSYLMLAQKGTSSYAARLDAAFGLSSGFNGGALLTISNAATVNDFVLDQISSGTDTAQSFYAVGTYSGAPWVKHYSSAGVINSNFTLVPVSGMTNGNAIVQQSCGRLVIAGTDGSTGVLAGHSIDGSVDEFGVSGKYSVPNSSDIYALTIDNEDRLIVAFKNGVYVNVSRIYANGGGVDSTFAPVDGDRISGVAADDQIKIMLDENGDIVVGAATSTGYKVRRYSATDGSLDTTFNGSTGELSFAFSTSTGTPKITNMICESSGKMVVSGYNAFAGDDRSIIARITATGELDATFNTVGVDGIYEFETSGQTLEYYGLALHQDRRLMVLGRDTVSGDVLLARVFGDGDDYVSQVADHTLYTQIPGQFDTEFGINGAFDLSALSGVGNNQAKIVRTTSGGRTLVAIDTGSVTKLVALGGQNSLDTSFSGSGIAITTCPTGVQDMYIDQNEKILVLGTTGGASWLRRYNRDGSNDTTFGIDGLVTSTITAAYVVREQSNGRILVGGLNDASGSLIAYTASGALDLSFSTGTGSGAGTGLLAIGSEAIYSFVIDSLDRVVVAVYNGTDVTMSRYKSNGYEIDTDFGTSGSVVNALGATITGASQVRVAFDAHDNLILVGATASTLELARYDIDGLLDGTFGTTSGYTTLNQSGVTLTDFIISQEALLGQGDVSASEGNLIIMGYQNLADDRMFVTWLTQDGILDTSFNPTTVVPGGPGYVLFEVDAANSDRQLCSGALLENGKLLLAGYENTGASNVPLLVQFYGQNYTDQQAQVPVEATPGAFDNTLNLTGKHSFTFGSGSVQQYAQTVWDLGTGYSLVGGYGTTSADATYNHFLITKFDTAGNLDTAFGSSGVVTAPLLTAATNEYLYDMVVEDDSGSIIVVGYQNSGSGVGLIRRYTEDGFIDTTFGDLDPILATPTGSVATPATKLYAVGLQSTGRILAVGEDNTALNKGVINAYTADGILDLTFGLNGQWFIDDASAIYSFAIDINDNITVVYKNSSTNMASMARVPYNGNQYDLTFGTNGKVANLFGSAISATDKVKVVIDENNKVVAAASMSGENTVKIRRYDSSGVVDTSFNSTGAALTITSGNAADRTILTKLLTNSAGQYVLVGYQDVSATTNDKFWIAQVTSAGIIDSLFNPASSTQAGENLFTMNGAGSLQKLMGAMISTEGKIVSVGQETVSTYSNPVMAVLFDSQYADEVQPTPADVDDGAFDPSYDTDGMVTVYANGATASTSNQQAAAVRVLPSGKSMVVISNDITAWTLRIKNDGSVDTAYSATGVAVGKSAGDETVTRMELDGRGRMLVIGTNSISGGYVKRLNTDGSLDTTFNPGGSVPGAIYGVMTAPYAVVEFKSGKIMVAGADSGVGTAKMYTSVGALDSSFSGDGVYTNGASITSIAVDENDNVFMAVGYLVVASKKVRIVAMNSVGTLSTTFGSSGVVNAAISDIDAYANIRLALNPEYGVIVAASWNGSTGKIGLRRYTELGVASSTFNSGSQFDITFSTSVVLTDLVTLEDGNIMVGAYQNGASPSNYSVIARVTELGGLDLDFNGTGKQIFQINSSAQDARVFKNMSIQQDGKILATVSESPASGQNVPSLVRAYGAEYVKAVLQFPGAGTPGTADINFGRLQDGISKIYFGTDIDLAQYGKGVALTTSDQVLLLGNGYTDNDRTYQHFMFARLKTDGLLDTNIGGAFNGAVPGTVITPLIGSNSEVVSRSLKDQFGRVLVAGYINSATHKALIRRYSPSGVLDSSFGGSRAGITHATIEEFNAIGIQALGGKIILGGTYNGDGVLIAYATNGTIDNGFGSAGNGIYTFGDSSDIRALVIGSNDIIYVARKVGTDLKISAVTSNGSGLVPGFGGTGEITALSNINGTDKVSIAVDGDGKLVVAATITSGADSRVQVKRYLTTGNIDPLFNNGSVFTLFTGDQSDRTNIVTKVLTTTTNKILVVGYQDITGTTSDYMFVANVLSDGSALNGDFNPNGSTPGLYTLRVYQTGENSQFTDAQIQLDGKIILIGNEAPSFGGTTPVVVRIHADEAAVSQVPPYTNPRPSVAVSGAGGATANSLSNSVSAATSGAAASQFAGSFMSNHRRLLAGAIANRRGMEHVFGSGVWKKYSPLRKTR